MTDQEKREKVVKGLECCMLSYKDGCDECPYVAKGMCQELLGEHAIALLKAQEPITGETSDGYHTFNELYHHRAVLFSVIVANYPDKAWKSKKHHDGTMYDDMFIVGIDTPDGQATYHYDIDPYWDMFKCCVLDNAPEWDGHTPAQAIERIGKLALLKAQEPRVMTLEEACSADCVWYDWRTTGVRPAKVSRVPYKTGTYRVQRFGDIDEWNHADEYGEYWRCWTSRPTDEQREATPWR